MFLGVAAQQNTQVKPPIGLTYRAKDRVGKPCSGIALVRNGRVAGRTPGLVTAGPADGLTMVMVLLLGMADGWSRGGRLAWSGTPTAQAVSRSVGGRRGCLFYCGALPQGVQGGAGVAWVNRGLVLHWATQHMNQTQHWFVKSYTSWI